ncbi:MAG: DUF3237 domain-containing protein [Actinobacteria bacterium]|nr:DUF3237 domain-containing protein [Actinomycetota bacterium]
MDLPRMELKTEFLYRAHIDVEGLYEVGETFRGKRTIVKVKGGWFEGPRVKGEILQGTGDWFIVRPDGVAEGDVRDTYRTHDGHIIFVSYRGIINMPPEIWEKLGRGEDADPSAYYLRGQPMFETALCSPYSWLNNTLAVSVGKQAAMGVTYDVYQVL